MKFISSYKWVLCILYPVFLLNFQTSCIRDELPNSEADILECWIPDMPEGVISGGKIIKPSKGSHMVKIWITPGATVGVLSPEFLLTPGASVSPASGTSRDFSEGPQTYVVTSEDGKYKKEYKVQVESSYVLTLNGEKKRTFSFENYEKAEGNYLYQEFYEWDTENSTKQYIWGSGNRGFGLTNSKAPAEKYPTFSYERGKIGRGVMLVTRSTGSFGAMVGLPLAAGNLFIGTFDISQATKKPLEATRFGMRANIGEPDSLNVWYKFRPGEVYKDIKGNVIENKRDLPSIYAVFYEPRIINGEPELLDGRNVLDASNIISVAQLDPAEIVYSADIETAEYTYASVPFVKRREIDHVKLKNGDYFIAVVFSSSDRGKYFEGAEGSTLCVDEVELICK